MTATSEECTACGHANTLDARFCGGCGTEIVRRCGECDAPQPTDARFCNQCGSALTDATPAATDDPVADQGATRKEVTVLFADLVGSTAFGEQVDPEAARATMSRFFEIIRRSIEVHDGTVAKFMGDGVMAVFGIPAMAEDDAQRAVLAGLEIQQQFGAFADMVRRRHDATLGLRIGVNTGEVVIAVGDDDMIGDAINTAARIEAACTPGRVLVGEPTWRLTRSSIRYRDHGDVDAKGKSEPLATFEVESTRADDADDTPFVGRAAELAEIRAVAGVVTAQRRVRLVSVVGPPGVGKTRLARQLVLDGDARTFDVRIERRQSTTFAPIADLIRQVVGIPDGLGTDDERAAIVPLVGQQTDGEQLVTALTSILAGGGGLSTEQLFTTVRRLLEVIGGDGPITIVFDDVQWAEPLFWDLLDHLVEWTTGVPVLMVALARPELRDLRPALCQPGRTVARSITLDGLQPDETEQLAARLLRAEAIPSELSGRLPASTDGNPLFVREFVQMLVDDGVLERGDTGNWHLTIEADAIEVPPTIQSLLASRIERLDADQRQLVEFASVIGTEFDRGVLVALAGPGSGPAIRRTLDSLQHMELIAAVGLWSGDEPVYRFHHVLIRDAAYRRILKGRRAELHLAAAEWISEYSAGSADEVDVTVGYHLERAHRYRTELGADDDDTVDIGRRAADLLGSAAKRALDRDDLQSSGGLVLRALECIASGDQRLPDLLLVGCEALLSTGDVARGAELVAALEALDGDDRLEAWTTCFRSQLVTLTEPDALDRAGADAESAAALLESLDDKAGVAKARLVRAGALARLGRIGDCEAELDLALTAARAADDRRNITAVLGAAPVAALWGPSPVARAGGRCLDVLRLLRITSASPAVEATSIRCQAVLEALRGRYDSARTMLATARGICEENGIRQGLLETTFYAGLVELSAGDAVAAEGHLRGAYDQMGQLGLGADAGQAAAHLARALLRQDRVDEADEMARVGERLAGRNPQTGIVARAVRAEVLSAQGRHEDAIRLADEAVEVASVTDILVDHANALRALARVHTAAGNDTDAAAAREAADAIDEAKGATGRLPDDGGEPTTTIDEPDPERPERSTTTATRSPDHDNRAEHHRLDEPAESVPANQAAMMVLRQLDLMLAGDLESIAAMHAEHAVSIDHRPMTGVDLHGREEIVASMREVTRGLRRTDCRLIETRGDRLVLLEGTNYFTIGSVDLVHIARTTEGGLFDLLETFDPEDLDAARRRFDELADAVADNRAADALDRLAGDGAAHGPSNLATRTNEAFSEAYRSGDFDAIASMFAATATATDRRAVVGLDEQRPYTDFLESLRFWHASGFGLDDSLTIDVLAVRGDHLALTAQRGATADGSILAHLDLTEVDDDGRFVNISFFDIDDLARALDELGRRDAELGGPHAMTAPRAEMLDRFSRAAIGGDTEAALACLHPSFSRIDERRLAATVDTEFTGPQFVAVLDSLRDLGIDSYRSTPLASWRDRLLLSDIVVTSASGDAFHVTAVTTFGDDGRLTWMTTFDQEDRHLAVEAFAAEIARGLSGLTSGNQRPTDGAEEVSTFSSRLRDRQMALLKDFDSDAIARTVSDEFVQDDRRPGVQTVFDKAGHLANVSAIAAFDHNPEFRHELIAHRGARRCAHRITFVDDLENAFPFMVAGEFSLDGVQRREIVVDPDPALAERALDELVETQRRNPELVNTATMAEERRNGSVSVVAVTDEYGAVIEREGRLVVIQSDDEAQVRDIATFDLDELGRAIKCMHGVEPLAEPWAERIRRAAHEMYQEFSSGDDISRFFDGDFNMADHRKIGWGPESTVDERSESLRSLGSIQQYGTKIHALRPGRACDQTVQRVTTEDGFSVETRFIVVTDFDETEPLRITRTHQFSVDQLDEALEFFDNEPIAGSRESRPTFAMRCADELAALFDARDHDGYTARLAEGFTHSDRRTGSHVELDSQGQIESNLEIFRLQGMQLDREHLAHRGARWCAHRCSISGEIGFSLDYIHISEFSLDGRLRRAIIVDDDPELAEQVLDELVEAEMRTLDLLNTATMAEERDRGTCDTIAVNLDHLALIRRNDQLVIIQSDDQANITDLETFPLDQLASAGHRVEALAMESERATDLERRQGAATVELGRFFNGAGEPGMVLDPRLEMIDHRPLGWGASSTVADRFRTIDDIGSFSQISAKIIAHRGGRLCVLQRQYFVTNDGFENAIDCILVFDIDGVEDPQVIGIHQYGSEQLGEALDHFDSAPITPVGRVATASAPANFATRHADRFLRIANTFDADAVTATFSDDYRHEDRRDGARVVLTRDDQRANVASMAVPGARFEHELLATRGARRAAYRYVFTEQHGFEVEFVNVAEYTLDGLRRIAVVLDLDPELTEQVLDELVEAEMRTLELVNTATMAEQRDHGACDTIAVRLDDLALVRRNDQLVIVRTDDHADLHDVATFAIDDVAAADHRLDLLALEQFSDLQQRQFRGLVEAMRTYNLTGDVSDIAQPDAAYVDHRPLGFGTTRYDSRSETLDGVALITQTTKKTLAVRDGRICVLIHEAATTEAGFTTSIESIHIADVNEAHPPEVTALHQFGIDQLDEALDFFDNEPIAASTDESTSPLALRTFHQFVWHIERGETARAKAMLVADYTIDDRRTGARIVLRGEEALENLVEVRALMPDLRVEIKDHGSLGARVCFTHQLVSSSDGSEIEFISVDRVTSDGRIEASVYIDPDPELATEVMNEMLATEQDEP